jgi:hypothetical protein
MKVLHEDYDTEDSFSIGTADPTWPDVRWEETPFRASDDITLLSYGFHFASDGVTLYREDGWLVDCSKPIPVWFHNNERIGGRNYDDVANQFGKEKRCA